MSNPQSAEGYDPGWNDPPMLAYDSRQVISNTKKPSLNKRVGLSWSSSPAPQPSTELGGNIQPASAPPIGPCPGPPPPCFSVKGNSASGPPMENPTFNTQIPSAPTSENELEILSQTSSASNDENQDQLAADNVLPFLYELAEQLFVEKEREKAEVTKRLSLIESSWKEDKFSIDVKDKLLKITEALKIGNIDCADQFQRSLMVDHSAICSPWMAAIRKLLAEKRSNLEK